MIKIYSAMLDAYFVCIHVDKNRCFCIWAKFHSQQAGSLKKVDDFNFCIDHPIAVAQTHIS